MESTNVDKPSMSDKRMNSASLGYEHWIMAWDAYGHTLSQIGTCVSNVSQEFDCSPLDNQTGNVGLFQISHPFRLSKGSFLSKRVQMVDLQGS